MIAEYNRKSLWFGIPGLVLQLGVQLLPVIAVRLGAAPAELIPQWLAGCMLAGLVLGSALLVTGLCYYAKAKGHSGVWGILGLLSCLGLVILALLPDRAKDRR